MSTDDVPMQGEMPWILLDSIAEIEQWVAQHDYELQRLSTKATNLGCGICFTLGAGGAIFLHTTADGAVLLDVTPDATWASPVITAATLVSAPSGQVWMLPADTLTQLLWGLNQLIDSYRLVMEHRFRYGH